MIYIMPKKKGKQVEFEPEPEPELVLEPECACYSPETCTGECPAIEEIAPVKPEPEPEPEPEPVKPKKLRPCERVKTPEELERRRLHRLKRNASRAAYLKANQR